MGCYCGHDQELVEWWTTMYRPCLVMLAFGVAVAVVVAVAADSWGAGREVLSMAPREEAYVSCQSMRPFTGVRSQYNPWTNERSWSFICHSRAAAHSCWGAWMPEHSQLHANFSLSCPQISFLSRIGSRSYPSHSDREWQLYCSGHAVGHRSSFCRWTVWLSPLQNFSFDLLMYDDDESLVLQGMESRYIAGLKDRQWRYLVCDTHPCASHSNTTPSHTHSNVTAEVPCDPGYYQNGTACYWNGTLTGLPTCAKCPPIPHCAQTVCAGPLGSRCLRCQPTLPSGLSLVLSRSGRRCQAVPVISPGPLQVGFMTGSNVLLNCSAKGRPSPRISWLRVLSGGEVMPVLSQTIHKNGSLTITNATDMDSGLYVCMAWNSAGSDEVHIEVYNRQSVAPPSIFHWHPLHIISSQGPTQLHCHTGGFPPPHVTWSYLNTSMQPPSFHTIPSSRAFQYQNGTLQFHLVRYKDTAVYRCEAENLFGQVAMETLAYMQTGPAEATPPHSIPDWTTSYSASEGERVEIMCSTSSLPPHSSILWMRKGGRAASGGTGVWQNGNGTLIIEHVSKEEEGPYWCVVWNEDYVAMESTNLVINGTGPPLTPSLSTSDHLHLMPTPTLMLAALLCIWHNL